MEGQIAKERKRERKRECWLISGQKRQLSPDDFLHPSVYLSVDVSFQGPPGKFIGGEEGSADFQVRSNDFSFLAKWLSNFIIHISPSLENSVLLTVQQDQKALRDCRVSR